jgi:hypothetical protein
MPLRNVSTHDVTQKRTVIYKNPRGGTRSVVITARYTQGSPVTGLGAVPSASGGTLATATYGYRVSAVVHGLESQAAAEQTAAVTGPTGSVAVSWTAVANAQRYKVYGRTQGAELFMATVTAPTVTFTDTGAVTPAGALPGANTDSSIDAYDPHTAHKSTGPAATAGVQKATGMRGATGTDRYHFRY